MCATTSQTLTFYGKLCVRDNKINIFAMQCNAKKARALRNKTKTKKRPTGSETNRK